MNILISQRVVKRDGRGDMDALETDYVKFFQGFGARLLPVSNKERDIEAYASELSVDAVVLSGGNDVDPKLYGGAVSPGSDYSEDRDTTERALLRFAIQRKLPVLGICRGAQFINVFFGGKLIADISKETGSDHIHPHAVEVIGERALAYFGKGIVQMNSYHRQGITNKELSSELRAFATGKDGSIEGIYHPAYPIAGVMWHPEREGCDKETNTTLIGAFIRRELFWNVS